MKYLEVIMVATGLVLAGCSKENGGPKADVSVSVDTGDAKDKINNALDKTGVEMKKAGNEAKAGIENAGDAIKKKADEAKDKLSDDKKTGVKVEVNTK